MFGSVKHVACEGQCVSWLQPIRIATVPIGNFSLKHIKEFGALMLKGRKGLALIIHRYEEGFEQLPGPTPISEQVVRMAALGADTDHLHALASLYLLSTSIRHGIFLEKLSESQAKGRTGTLDDIERRCYLAVLNFAQHPGADTR